MSICIYFLVFLVDNTGKMHIYSLLRYQANSINGYVHTLYNVQLHCTILYTVWYYPKVYYCGNNLYVTFCSVYIDRCASLSKKTDR